MPYDHQKKLDEVRAARAGGKSVNKKAKGPYFHADIDGVDNISAMWPEYLSPEQAEEWNRDPDEYARKKLGFVSKDEYYEYLELQGQPLCGQRTKKGELCRHTLTGFYKLEPRQWREVHRMEYCKLHEVAS